MKNVLLTAYGSMGRLYANLISSGKVDGLHLQAVICRHPAKNPGVYGHGAGVFQSFEEALEKAGRLDAVIITSPHKTHVQYIKQALEAGLEVLCEKPLSDTLASTNELEMLPSHERERISMIFNWRSRASMQCLKARLQRLGRISYIHWIANFWYRTDYYHKSSPWRSTWSGEGGGLLINQAQHLLDIWNFLFGLPDSVYAEVDYGKWRDISVDDGFTALLSYDDGRKGVLASSTIDSPGSNHLEVHGENGKLVLDGKRLVITENVCSSIDFAREADSIGGLRCHSETIDFPEDEDEYVKMLSSFADGCHVAGLEDGRNALMLAQAIYLSAWKGCPVRTRQDDEEYGAFIKEKLAGERSGTHQGLDTQ